MARSERWRRARRRRRRRQRCARRSRACRRVALRPCRAGSRARGTCGETRGASRTTRGRRHVLAASRGSVKPRPLERAATKQTSAAAGATACICEQGGRGVFYVSEAVARALAASRGGPRDHIHMQGAQRGEGGRRAIRRRGGGAERRCPGRACRGSPNRARTPTCGRGAVAESLGAAGSMIMDFPPTAAKMERSRSR